VTQNERSERIDAGQRAGISEAELQERVTQLLQRRSKLSADEAVLLRNVVFPTIVKAHSAQVSKFLRSWKLERSEKDDLYQETFLTLHSYILERGFPDNIPGMLHSMVEGKVSNYMHVKERVPFSIGLMSSTSEPPRSAPDLDFAVDMRTLVRCFVPQLSLEHQEEVIDKVIVNGFTYTEAAAVLGIPERTVNSRLAGAKHALRVLIAPFVPVSQRGLP
jgi:DNA-directed RNA polymerase specialized sigma24 family protein